ncbi:glutaredoxin family protein [Natronosporangium hydrolyticum]|uniref:Glutaredoxin family protein n=1 Tax=Natronosporangium hydrolyticum TaxID=2811111 RepID=A0A895Y9L7_9ACTN|nr:glutaredoxin family protein [Natronosporangium hydrolyticum]QSB14437.1 glutaredoxin family protein [Natronosporangium hydrolyticum]
MTTAFDGPGAGVGHPEESPESVRITLLVRPGCHLCDYAREALGRVAETTGERWHEVSVESDPELEREYGGRVPVVLLDGREHDYFRVDEARLRRDLTGAD